MGRATTELVAGRGARVVVVDRAVEGAAAVADSIGGIALAGDVGDSGFCDSVVADTIERFGRLDGLVNAAGIIVRASGVETSDEAWHRIMNVNVSGTFFLCRAALRVMVPAKRGAIVNFGSIWGDLGSSGVAAYCASKGAVHNLTRALAMDHAGDGVRINAVCPGEVRTPMLQSERSEPVTQDMLDRIASTVPMGRLAEPIEIARVVAFLLSDDASYMTGTMVSVDAGYGARSMHYRRLGRSGAKVSCLALGTDNILNPTPEDESIRMILAALDAGITLIDTSNSYAAGESERVIGRALNESGRRDEAFIATKAFFPAGTGPNDRGGSRVHLMRACEDSLRRLGTDHIDLYQLHRPDFDTPIEETLSALTDLVRAGKVRYIGSSTAPAWRITQGVLTAEMRGLEGFVTEQPPYNLLDRRIEN